MSITGASLVIVRVEKGKKDPIATLAIHLESAPLYSDSRFIIAEFDRLRNGPLDKDRARSAYDRMRRYLGSRYYLREQHIIREKPG